MLIQRHISKLIICDVGPRNLISQLNFHYHHFQKTLIPIKLPLSIFRLPPGPGNH